MSRLGVKAVLVFCSNRVLRGGPRVILQVLAFILTIFILVHLLPERLGGGGFSYKNILTWKSPSAHAADLRIVVFGSPDVAGSAVDSKQKRTTWTEQLCREVRTCPSRPVSTPFERILKLVLDELLDTHISRSEWRK